MMEERLHGDLREHKHEGYDYWHPITRIHEGQRMEDIGTDTHIGKEYIHGLQVNSFDWETWDAGCHAKGICQGYSSILTIAIDCAIHDRGQPCLGWSDERKACTHSGRPCAKKELHHRDVSPDYKGIAVAYWQCPHCRPLQKLIQWAEGARLETYNLETRGNKVVLWLKVSSGQWYVLVTYNTIQQVASLDCLIGTAYAVGNYPPQQMPDEIAVALARRFWHKITKGYWSDVPKEKEE